MLTPPRPAVNPDSAIFVRMAVACLLIVITGFTWNAALGRILPGVLSLATLLHLILFLGWNVIAIVQPLFAGRAMHHLHRKIGWCAVLLALGMCVSGLWVTTTAIAAGRAQPANIFMMLNILTVICFAGLVGAAMMMRRRTDWHGRLLTCATILLTGPAWARLLPMQSLGGAGLFAISGCVILIASWGAAHDRRRRGRVHPAWYWGAATAAIIGPLTPLLAFMPVFDQWVSAHLAR